MKISQMLPSTYLKKEDIDQPVIVTVDRLEQNNVAPQGQPDEMKWILYFTEFEKGLVLNSTNIQLLSRACGSDDTDDWPGKEVVLYVDPNVSYAGKVTGGLRIRTHETRAPARPTARTQTPARAMSDSEEHANRDVPF